MKQITRLHDDYENVNVENADECMLEIHVYIQL